MDILQSMMILVLLVACSFFLSLSEIAIAGSRKLKLKLIAESGEERANKVIELQENSADFFASTQVGVNAVAILGGIVGDTNPG